MFERVGNSEPHEITFDQLTRTSVPSSKILYAGKDYAGKYNILVFDDVTGDQYDYGFLIRSFSAKASFRTAFCFSLASASIFSPSA